jgi:hypothetical protein
MPKGHRITGVLAALIAAVPVMAQDAGSSMFKVSGFGTLAATHSSEKYGDFISNFSQPEGPGLTRTTDFGEDSRLGLQLDWKIGAGFSAVVQGVSERRYDKTFRPYVIMAHLKYQISPGLAIRAGRIPYSAYLISDYQKVGYAQPWVRPPVEVYQFNPLTYVNGGDLDWQFNTGPVAWSGQILGGSTSTQIAPSAMGVAYTPPGQKTPDSEWKGDDLWAAGVAANIGHATFRGFYLQMKGSFYDAGFDGALGPFAGMGPFVALRTLPPAMGGNAALADQFQIRRDKVVYESLGFNFDPGNWFFMSEVTRKAGDEDILLAFVSGYATVGVRLGNWTPYATGAWKHTTSATGNSNPIINALVSGLDRGQSSYSAGLRWDFLTGMALKAQLDHVKNVAGGYGAFTNTTADFQPGGTYNLATLALDFVF